MKCSIKYLLLLLLCFNCYADLLAQQERYIVRTTISTCLNVRTTPETSSEIIACLTPGTEVLVLSSVPFWREVSFGNNQKGWVAKKYIEPITDNDSAELDSIYIPSDAYLTVHFVDVGQGDAIWIQTHDDGIDGNGIFEGYAIVIDGGPYAKDESNPFLHYMLKHAHQQAEIEALFITHPHTDHFNGAVSIANRFEVNHYYDPGYPSDVKAYVGFKKLMQGTALVPGKAKEVHIGKSSFGKIDWGKEIKAEILYSWGTNPDNSLGTGNTEINNASIVLRVQYGKHVFLFMGDAEGKDRHDSPEQARYVEKILLETVPEKLKSTVLKIAHHGSETSSSLPFISAVNPDIVVVQSGRKSFSGTYLPDMTTLKRYCDNNPNVMIYRTDQNDAKQKHKGRAAADNDHITIRSNGLGTPQVRALEGGKPFNKLGCN